jgi:hypothetical protein
LARAAASLASVPEHAQSNAPAAQHGVEKLSRREVARALGVTKSAVRYLERTGQLHAIPDANGEATFVRADVIAYAAKRLRRASRNHRSGDGGLIAADIFARFAAAESVGRLELCLPEIVRATCAPPALVRALYAEYRTPLGLRPAPAPPAAVVVDAAAIARDELAAAREARELEARILARHEASDAEHARALRDAEREDEREDDEHRARRARRRETP